MKLTYLLRHRGHHFPKEEKKFEEMAFVDFQGSRGTNESTAISSICW